MRALSGWTGRRLPIDVVMVAAVAVFIAVATPRGADVGALGFALIGAGAGGLLARRRWPGLALAVASVSTLAFVGLGHPAGPVFVTVMIGMYSVAVRRSIRYALIAATLVALPHLLWSLPVAGRPEGVLDLLVSWTGWLVAPLGLGVAVRGRREVRARADQEERRRQVYEERLRMAQEVHDVVGHSLAMISLNAGVALHVLAKQQAPSPQVETALRAIRQAGTGALDELRGTLDVFTGQVAAPCPAPGLAALPRLVEATNVDGLSVTLDVAGEAGRVPPAVDAAGYRIVQEALTNVVRHAAAGNAAVKVTYRPRRVELRVTDDGEGSGVTGEGSGLAGMRGRARSVGGTLSAGPRDGGGFEVRTVLPHDPEPSE